MKRYTESQRLRPAVLLALLLSLTYLFRSDLFGAYTEAKARLSLDFVEVESPRLSSYSGTPVSVRAAVLIPDSLPAGSAAPIMFHFPGFGENRSDAWRWAARIQKLTEEHPELSMVHVLMDPSIAGGYSYFTDSENNGPWASALIAEFIPELERKLHPRILPGPRFLTGHSSGGWTALWIQLHAPDVFAGVWATGPDPIDLSDFYGVDLRPGSTDSFYLEKGGAQRPAARSGEWRNHTLREYVAADEKDTATRGDIASYEWAYSGKDTNGDPRRLFDRTTGALNQDALRDWERFDLRKILESLLPSRAAALRGKIHIWTAGEDDYFLERPAKLFCSVLVSAGIEGSCIEVPGRGHKNLHLPHAELYPGGLMLRILSEAASRKG